jgi:HEAT repeat protein
LFYRLHGPRHATRSVDFVDVVARRLLSVLRQRTQVLVSDILPQLLQPQQDDRFTAQDLLNTLSTEKFDFAHAAKALRAKESAAIPYIIKLLDGGNQEQQQAALTLCVDLSKLREHCKDLAVGGAVEPLIQLLTEDNATVVEQVVETLKNVAENLCIGNAGFSSDALAPLVRLLTDGTQATQGHAASLLKIFAYNDGNVQRIIDAGAVPPLLHLLRDGVARNMEAAAGALGNLVWAGTEGVISAGVAVPLLVRLLQEADSDVQLQAATALGRITSNSETSETVRAAGAVPVLVRLLEAGECAVKEEVAGILWKLLGFLKNNHAFATSAAGAIPLLAQVLREGNDLAKEQAIYALTNLAHRNEENLAAIAQAGVFPLLMQLEMRSGSTLGSATRRAIDRMGGSGHHSEARL